MRVSHHLNELCFVPQSKNKLFDFEYTDLEISALRHEMVPVPTAATSPLTDPVPASPGKSVRYCHAKTPRVLEQYSHVA